MRTYRVSDELVIVPEWVAAVHVDHQKYVEQVTVEPAWYVSVTLVFGTALSIGWFRYIDPRSALSRRSGGFSAESAERMARDLAARVSAAVEAVQP